MLPENSGWRMGMTATPPMCLEGHVMVTCRPVCKEVFDEEDGAPCTAIGLGAIGTPLGRQSNHWPLEQQQQQDVASVFCRHRLSPHVC